MKSNKKILIGTIIGILLISGCISSKPDPDTFFREMNKTQNCMESGGEWVVKTGHYKDIPEEKRNKIIEKLKSSGEDYQIEELPGGAIRIYMMEYECICSEGFIINYCSTCAESLNNGTIPETKEECENGGGTWEYYELSVVGEKPPEKNEIPNATHFTFTGYHCACKEGHYWSKNNKCEKIPLKFICKSTCGEWMEKDNKCECPTIIPFSEQYGCMAGEG